MAKRVWQWVAAALVLALVLTAAACKNREEADRNAYEKIQNALLSMTGYEAEATVTYITNKNQHSYTTKQQARMSGEYRIEVTGPENVAGNITVNDNNQIVQFNTKVQGRIAVCPGEVAERLELFVTSFVKNYMKSQGLAISVANMGGSVCTVMEAVIPGDHPFLRTEKLWVSNKTYKPVKLSIYDDEGVERITVTFETFEYNVNFEDKIFKAQ